MQHAFRNPLRKLASLVVIALILSSAYWVLTARAIESAVADWFEARAQSGWQSEYGAIQTSGFPAQFETTLSGLALADPATGVALSASDLSIQARSRTPNHVTFVLPNEAQLATPLQKISLRNTAITAALDVAPSLDFQVQSAEVTLREAALASTLGWAVTLDQAHIMTAATELGRATLTSVVSVKGLAPTPEFKARLDPKGRLPEQLTAFDADVTTTFTAPWSLASIELERPQPTRIAIKDMQAVWGSLAFRAAGTLDVDAQGIPTGKLDIRAQNWREMVQIAISAGAIPPEVANLVEGALGFIAHLGPDPERLDLTLSFAGGQMLMGPLPLGPAPRLVIR